MRPLIHYLACVFVIGLYGGQVCPFLESLTTFQLLLPVVAALTLAYLLRRPFRTAFVDRVPYQQQTYRVFWLEFLLFVAVGLFLTFFNYQVHSFPFSSGLKLVLAMTTLGFFLAVDLALAQERELVELFGRQRIDLDPEQYYFPLPTKMATFAAACAVFVAGVVFLLINKDIDWLVTVGRTMDLAAAQKAILLEVVFVFLVILAYVMNLIISVTRNLRTFFDNENSVLKAATGGILDGSVPVTTNDEFGVMAKHTNLMIVGLKEKTEELQRTRDVTIMSLASLAETRDNETGAHLLRTQRYVKKLAEYLQRQSDPPPGLSDETIDLLFKSAPLHDIGKVGIPDHILLKPGSLTPEEFAIMKTHATLGGDALRVAEESLGSNSFLRLAREIAYCHHEKWNGSGYPLGLRGEAIPLSGRIMALADVYDALISKRVYKEAFSHDRARDIIVAGRETHFDPRLVEAFLAMEGDFVQTAREFSDEAYLSGSPGAP